MKNLLIISILSTMLMFSGCGQEAGIAGGFAASETLKGLQADLDRRQKALVQQYNDLVDAGAKAETLESMRRKIDDLETAKQTAAAIPEIAKTNWGDPAAAGGAIGMITALGYAWLKRRDQIKISAAYENTVNGIKSYRAGLDETAKQALDKTLLDKKAVT